MKVAVWIGVLLAAALAVFVFTALAASVLIDARDMAADVGWWTLAALAFPATIAFLAWRS